MSMGTVALAAKITHVPSMYLSELPGERHGTRQDAIDGTCVILAAKASLPMLMPPSAGWGG